MASIARRPEGRWRARYRDADGREHAKHFPRKVDAQRWLDEVTASVVRGDYVDPRAGKVTLKEYAASWEAVQVSSEGTRRIVDNALRLHLLPALGHVPIAAVRTTQLQGWVKALEERGLAAGTVRNIYDVAQQVFAAAVDDRVIATTPCRRVRLPRGDDEEVVPPTVDEVWAVADAIGQRWRAFVVLLAGSGLRIGELRGLEVADVDFLRRTVSVERQRLQSGAVRPLKSKASRRVVPVGQVVLDELAAHLAAYGPRDRDGAPVPGPLVLDEFHEPLPYWRWKRLLAAATSEVLDDDGKVTRAAVDVTAHDFRHYFASALLAGGASIKQVQVALGHASPVITLRTYAHLMPGDDDRTRNAMDAALRPQRPGADQVRTEAGSDG